MPDELMVRNGGAIESWEGAADRGLSARNERNSIIRQVLNPEHDFGKIPGCGDKPALLKPGAEKIADSLNLYPDYEPLDARTREDWEKGLFNYSYRCRLRQRGTDAIVATGIGSCNSLENRYRWRKVPAWEATEQDKERAVKKVTRKSKKGNTVTFLTVPNDDIYTQVNTVDKMAQKRAMVAATLNLGFSEQFTQDIEDNPEVFGGRPVETPPPAEVSSGTLDSSESPASESAFDLRAERKRLGKAILEFCGGDKEQAQIWCRTITAGKDFDGFRSVGGMKHDWQFKQAWTRFEELKKDNPETEADDLFGGDE